MVQYLCIHLSRGMMTWQSDLHLDTSPRQSYKAPPDNIVWTMHVRRQARKYFQILIRNLLISPVMTGPHFYKADGQDRDLEPHGKDFPRLPLSCHHGACCPNQLSPWSALTTPMYPVSCHYIIGYSRGVNANRYNVKWIWAFSLSNRCMVVHFAYENWANNLGQTEE